MVKVLRKRNRVVRIVVLDVYEGYRIRAAVGSPRSNRFVDFKVDREPSSMQYFEELIDDTAHFTNRSVQTLYIQVIYLIISLYVYLGDSK